MNGVQLDDEEVPRGLNRGDATLYIRDMPRGVKDHFKAYCDRRGKTMREVILTFMRERILKDAQGVDIGVKRRPRGT